MMTLAAIAIFAAGPLRTAIGHAEDGIDTVRRMHSTP